MINKYVRIIAGVLAVIWMCVIFSYSADEAEVSTEVSRSVSYLMVEAVSDMLHLGWDEARIDTVSRNIENTVRKLAHVTEYAILGLLTGVAADAWRYIGTDTRGIRRYVRMLIAAGICLVYASTDEYHQTFVSGRHGSPRDVAIDMIGVIVVMLIGMAVSARRRAKATAGAESGGGDRS